MKNQDVFSARKKALLERKQITQSKLFDAAYYISENNLPVSIDAAQHFCAIGWYRGYNPSAYFSTKFYLERYPDVRQAGINPLVHYLAHGGREKRAPNSAFDVIEFCAAHSARLTADSNPAELCIQWYGSYDWKDDLPKPKEISGAYVARFKKYFDEEFYKSMNPDVARTSMDPYEHFISHGQFEDRDPSPDIDIFEYKHSFMADFSSQVSFVACHAHGEAERDSPGHASDALIIDPSRSRDDAIRAQHPLKVCVHIHCYYVELISEILPYLQNLSPEHMVIITVVTEADRQFIQKVFARENYRGRVEIRLTPNRGRDLGPLIVTCRDLWSDYDVVLHLHTKRSPHLFWGEEWRQYLLDQTVGSRDLIQSVLGIFERQPEVGCLYPRNFHMIRRFARNEQNGDAIDSALSRLGHEGFPWRGSAYPAGSMAWYRTAMLKELVETFGSFDYFDSERDQLDGTFAHALERLMPIAVRAAGGRVVSYMTPRRTRVSPLKGLPSRDDSRAAVTTRWYRDTPRIAQRAARPLAPLSRCYNARSLDIHWIIPSFDRGAGGHMTIFRMIEFLERFGHFQTIWIQTALTFPDQAAAKKAIREWYRPIASRVNVRFLPEDVRELSGDVVIATDCWTAFPAAQTRNFKERFYFVQDYETQFHPSGEMQMIAESTYDFGFSALCAGTWLYDLMKARGLWARSWDLSADHDVYFPGVRQKGRGGTLRIAFYARAYTPRRAVGLGLAALEELHRRGINFHAELFGEDNLSIDYVFPHTKHGILKPAELGELYRNCDIGLVFSATNYSLIPLEMMACDLPVIELDTESTRAIFKNDEVTFAKPTLYAIADEIVALAGNPERQDLQKARGRRFVANTSWEKSARLIEKALFERLQDLHFTPVDPEAYPAPVIRQSTKATVFIPTFNAGSEFSAVLDRVCRQKCDFKFNVLIIDSGSSDGTQDLVRGYARRGVSLEAIPQSEFQHGRTRNLGIERSNGEFVAVITQDACPANDQWLARLIGGFQRGPRVAGVVGRHEAYADHDAFTRRDITEMFDNLALLPDVIDREIGLPSFLYPGGRNWRMLRQFHSDNNSAMSREFWKILKYPEIDWGEDQVWSDEMLRLGFQKSYASDAVVFHSHAFELEKHYKTAQIEGKFWGEYFGIDLHPDSEAAVAALDARDQDFAFRHGIPGSVLAKRKILNRATVEARAAGYALSRDG